MIGHMVHGTLSSKNFRNHIMCMMQSKFPSAIFLSLTRIIAFIVYIIGLTIIIHNFYRENQHMRIGLLMSEVDNKGKVHTVIELYPQKGHSKHQYQKVSHNSFG